MSKMSFRVCFDRVFEIKGERRPRRPVVRDEHSDDSLVVCAKDVEDAIAKVKSRELGVVDEEAGAKVVEIVITEVRRAGRIDIP